MQRVVTFKIDDSLLRAVDAAARSMGMSRSELIRAALIKFLRDNGYAVPVREEKVQPVAVGDEEEDVEVILVA